MHITLYNMIICSAARQKRPSPTPPPSPAPLTSVRASRLHRHKPSPDRWVCAWRRPPPPRHMYIYIIYVCMYVCMYVCI